MKNFTDLTRELKKIAFDELRKEEAGYIEIVFAVAHLREIYPTLEEYFGPPFKPAGISPSKEAHQYTARYGGIEKHQTLYLIFKEEVLTCAMVWPWQDKSCVTIKIAEGILPK